MNFSIRDPRYFQIIFLSSFAVYGFTILNWDFNFIKIATGFSCVLLTQLIFIKKLKLPSISLLSSIITALGLILLFRTNSVIVFAIAGATSVASKFLIQQHKKHIFNPVNFGIIITIIFTNQGWISPGQWGSEGIYILIVGVFGLLVLVKVKQLLNGIIFLGTLILLESLYLNFYLNWPLDLLLHKFSNGSILLFSFFMITDPRTTPNHPTVHCLWSFTIACISFYLMEFEYISTAPFWILFFISPLTPLLNKIGHHKHFNWNQNLIITSKL